MERRKFFREALLLSATVAVECTTVGLNTLFKAAASKGLSYYVFVAYSYPLATLALLPLPLIFRNTTTVVPSFKFSILSRIILLSFIGVLSQIFGYTGIACSSPTLSSAISNLTPAFTFTLAILFSVIGAVVICVGFYAVLWGKANEEVANDDSGFASLGVRASSDNTTPLLQSVKVEDTDYKW
uniref:Nodulin MtN21 /EamA-like transporter family protein n=1 Tax=Citrus limon TaxID=2708 RepID=A0A1S8ACA4_CITLI